ncbi:UNVERIFIED_CONTAM: SDR family oxidoreductase [Microbacterium sp. SLM126]
MEHSVIVTGVGAGIGKATAAALAGRGYRVVGVERDPAVARLSALAELITGDVSTPGVLEAALDAATSHGRLVGWVSNAARVDADPASDPEGAFLAGVLAVNVSAVARGTALAVDRFLSDGTAGSIVTVSSVHSRIGFAGHAAYDASKGAVESLARSTAARVGPAGIRCNAVAPGAVLTEKEVRVRRSGPVGPESIPLAMFSTPEEIAEIVAFLVSPASSAINAAVIRADKGLSSVFVDEPWKVADPGGIRHRIAL